MLDGQRLTVIVTASKASRSSVSACTGEPAVKPSLDLDSTMSASACTPAAASRSRTR
jgi:hypothetical protein